MLRPARQPAAAATTAAAQLTVTATMRRPLPRIDEADQHGEWKKDVAIGLYTLGLLCVMV